jgi:hypothetical protein
MLELAYFNQEKLNIVWAEAITKGRFKYFYNTPAISYKVEFFVDDWNYIQYVSKNRNNDILGYFMAKLERSINLVEEVAVIHFEEKSNAVFSWDIFFFFYDLLINRGFRKVIIRVIPNNPAFEMYDKFIKKYDLGRFVGVYKAHRLLANGKYCDEAIYEIYRENYISYIKCKPIPHNNNL